jgi:hypothetical protein
VQWCASGVFVCCYWMSTSGRYVRIIVGLFHPGSNKTQHVGCVRNMSPIQLSRDVLLSRHLFLSRQNISLGRLLVFCFLFPRVARLIQTALISQIITVQKFSTLRTVALVLFLQNRHAGIAVCWKPLIKCQNLDDSCAIMLALEVGQAGKVSGSNLGQDVGYD